MPEIGHSYDVSIMAIGQTSKEKEVISPETKEKFMTKPLPPTKLLISNREQALPLEICWHRSLTPNVISYKIRWKNMTINAEEIKTEEGHLENIKKDDEILYFCIPEDKVQSDTAYKVNVYAVAESEEISAESKELHEKFFINSEKKIAVHNDEEQVS